MAGDHQQPVQDGGCGSFRNRYGNRKTVEASVEDVCEAISEGAFQTWFSDRQYAENIREGRAYFNGPSSIKEPSRHSPSSLLQCQRRTTYNELNAPEETGDPDGIFWLGTRFEEDLILPFLEDIIAGEDEYVANSLWVDFSVETDVGDLQIKGATDPVLVDRESEPLILFEVKTKQSVDGLNSPDSHHRAQAHAYMKGLSEAHDRTISEAVVLYGSRTTFETKAFNIEFDAWFWEEVVTTWAASQTEYRLDDELPPAEPEREWECDFCAYRERCGEGKREFEDTGPTGLLPRYTEYPREKLTGYLGAYPNAELTPSLAFKFPELADRHGVLDWICNRCGSEVVWNEVSWDGDIENSPQCPSCSADGVPGVLRGPSPGKQPASGGNT
jgi:CRISPR-associated exonuclease Cas4